MTSYRTYDEVRVKSMMGLGPARPAMIMGPGANIGFWSVYFAGKFPCPTGEVCEVWGGYIRPARYYTKSCPQP